MAKKSTQTWLVDEVAAFLAASPSRDELLAYRPSTSAEERFRSLVAKSKAGSLNDEEEWELNQFEHLEILINQDNGPENQSRRTPFLKRMGEFAWTYPKGIHLSAAQMKQVEERVSRDAELGKWFLDIDGRKPALG